ncbi:MAG TPA: phosphoribosylanthranilate isomerase [Deltaproteobacteria bacterium]|nr:MAG: hypothetical protein A2048_09165 [Deltaproteobacteria bacterium GWA2_45_12]HBF12012.1 phosphoribosylanthranilate isomerase [Deltaproteobacteria bacterium]
MSVLVKICGLTNLDDAMDALDCGADLLGFNFYPDSPRYIDPELAFDIFEEIPGNVEKVGIFVNRDLKEVLDIAVEFNLDFLQFHGDETPEYCNQVGRPWFKAFRLKAEQDLIEIPKYESRWLLVDAHVEKAFGGTGVISDWHLAREAKKFGQLFLSGGLKPDNIEMALDAVKPYAVDVASGVEESPGIKDKQKMEEFVARVRAWSTKNCKGNP